MSFEAVCSNCGAPSGLSVGICPFCKSIMSGSQGTEYSGLNKLKEVYFAGHIDQALFMASAMCKANPDLKSDLQFVQIFVKILFETEGPSSQIRGLLAAALLTFPDNPALLDDLEVIEAKNRLIKGIDDPGELALRTVLRRSPHHVHAHFIL